jgi:hypothetical protein
VRKRITAGTIDAHKEGTAWVVSLPATTGAVPTEPDAAPAAPEGGTNAALGGTGTASVDLAPLVAHIEKKDEEIHRLRDAATGWQFRALRAEERLAQLTAGAQEPRDATEAPESVQEAPGRAEPPRVDDSTLHRAYDEPVPAQVALATSWRRWWRKVMGY